MFLVTPLPQGKGGGGPSWTVAALEGVYLFCLQLATHPDSQPVRKVRMCTIVNVILA
jgi:hypothetical protein